MTQQRYNSLKEQLLAIQEMMIRPCVSATGNAPEDGIDECLLNGRYFTGLRLTDNYLVVRLSAQYCFSELDVQYAERLKSVRAGKSCLKTIKPEQLDRSAVDTILKEGAANWLTN